MVDRLQAIHELVLAQSVGSLSPEQRDQLEQLVLQDDETCRLYVRYVRETVSLRWWAERAPRRSERELAQQILMEALEEDLRAQRERRKEQDAQRQAAMCEAGKRSQWFSAMRPEREPLTPVRHIVIPRPVAYGLAGGLAAMLAIAVWLMIPDPPSPAPVASLDMPVADAGGASRRDEPEPVPPPVETIAQVVRTTDARWAGTTDFTANHALARGHFELVAGVVEIAMAGGATLAFEGPAQFALHSSDTCAVSAGKLLGYCPPGSEGLIVRFPGGELVDLGTAFGVEVLDDGTLEIDVFAGTVGVALSPSGERTDRSSLTLERLEAMTVHALTGRVRKRASREAGFASLLNQVTRQPVLINSSFEYPATRHYSLGEAVDGWIFENVYADSARAAQERDALQDRVGVVLEGTGPAPADRPHGRDVPAAPHGSQWAYLTAATLADGVRSTRAWQSAGPMIPGGVYKLDLTVGAQRGRTSGAFVIALYSGPAGHGPKRELAAHRDMQPVAPGEPRRVQVRFQAPVQPMTHDEELFIVIESPATPNGPRPQLLFDDVQLQLTGVRADRELFMQKRSNHDQSVVD